MALALYRYSLPFRQPLNFNGHRLAHRQGLLICINGQWGEIAPLPGFSLETLEEAEAESLACLAALERSENRVPTLPSVQFGFECAQHRWPPLLPEPLMPYPLLQNSPRILMQALADIATRWGNPPPARIKLKVARYCAEDELALIRQLCARFPATQLILDANGGWSRDEALRFCQRLPLAHIDYMEEPCAALLDSIAVAEATGVPIALDETLSRGVDWPHHPGIAALVIKPTLIGAFSHCMALINRAGAHGMRVVISSSFESDLGLGLLAQLSREWAPNEPPGLDTEHWLSGRVTTTKGDVKMNYLHCLYHVPEL